MTRKKATKAPVEAPSPIPEAVEVSLVTVDTLATAKHPASGALIQRMVELLPVEEIANVVRGLIYATRVNAAGREVADTRAVEVGLRYWFGYVVGLPGQQAPVLQSSGTLDDMLARTDQSKAAERQLERQLEDSRKATADLERQVADMQARKTADSK